MFTPEDIRPLSAAVGSAALVGLAFGLWLTLPTMSGPALAEAEVSDQIDPNLAQYRRMMADNGISATPYILTVGYAPTPPEPVVEETPAQDDADQTAEQVTSDPVPPQPQPAPQPQFQPRPVSASMPTPAPVSVVWVAQSPQGAENARYATLDDATPQPSVETTAIAVSSP